MFHYIHTLIMFKHVNFGKHIWIHRSKIKKNTDFKISSRDDVFFSFFSSQDEISSRQKLINSKRHFTIDRDEISRVNTL